MGNPSRSLTKDRGGALHKGSPALLKAVALEYLKTFDEEQVAEKFDTTPRAVARVLSKTEIQEYLRKRMVPMQDIAELGARRLLEEAIKTAFSEEVEWKERVENRKLLARSLLPEFKKVTHEHNHYIRAPARADSLEEWQERNRPNQIPEADVEVVDE